MLAMLNFLHSLLIFTTLLLFVILQVLSVMTVAEK